MRAEITKLQQRLQTTCIYVTHDQVEAMTMGHRIAVMKDGKLQQVGTPLEVYENPANLFVANFIGTPPMNFIRATLAEGGSVLATGKFNLPLPQSLRRLTAGKDGRSVIAGIRPENILDPSRGGQGETHRLSGEVEIVETVGYEVIVHVRVGDELMVAKLDPHRAPRMGDPIELVVELEALHLFDAETERRLAA
jgi:multiple sugar transport system ATP-binding protein